MRKKRVLNRITATLIAAVMGASSFANYDALAQNEFVDNESEIVIEQATNTDAEEENGQDYEMPVLSYHGEMEEQVPSVYDVPAVVSNDELQLQTAAALPASYTSSYVTSVKNQNPYGTCWAFATIGASEANINKKYGTVADLSEWALAYFTNKKTVVDPLGGTIGDSFEAKLDAKNLDYLQIGGNQNITIRKLASWTGYTDETNASYNTVLSDKLASIDDSYAFGYDSYHLKNAQIVSMSDINVIKQLIMEYGACGAAYYHDDAYIKKGTKKNSSGPVYYYCEKSVNSNHAITIVGWDDSIKKEDFSGVQPSCDGAWIIKNSWGDDKFKNGYMYISYDDAVLKAGNAFFYDVVKVEDDYTYNYQYDGGALPGNYNYKVRGQANVFTAKSNEILKAVSYYTRTPGESATVKIYKNVTSFPISNSVTPDLSMDVTDTYAGYHTLDLPSDLNILAGEKYAIVITYSTYTTIEIDKTRDVIDSSCGEAWCKNVSSAKEGQSYITLNSSTWTDVGKADGSNCRIKAFTDPIAPENNVAVTGVTVSPTSKKLTSVGATATVTAIVLPSNATSKIVTWSNSNADAVDMATNADGTVTVTAKANGTATITATTADGGYYASCTITVDIPVAVQSITLDKASLTLTSANETNTIKANIFPYNATNKKFTWSITGDKNVVKLVSAKNGVLTIQAVGNGTTTITAKTEDGAKTASCVITVDIPPAIISVEGISLSQTSKEFTSANETLTLAATVSPSNATNKSVSWSSTNTAVATVKENADGTVTVTPVENGTATVTAKTADGSKIAECTISVNIPAPNVSVYYRTHVQNIGWESSYRTNGQMSGTTGRAYRLEAIQMYVDGNPNLGIQYVTHCQNYGWLSWSNNNEVNGTSGEAKRLEAIEINLTGKDKDKYDVYYRVHAQNYGWLGWAKNGAPSGTAGYAYRLEGIQVLVVKKGESINTNCEGITSKYSTAYISKSTSSTNISGSDTPHVAYQTHVQNDGWQSWKYDGTMAGTSGRSLRLEGINIKLTNKDYSGGITYSTHIQNIGWQSWKSDGDMSGTSGRSLRLEAIKIKLTGEMAKHYDVYYRVHAQNIGWMGWAKNGESAGTAGYAYRLEGIEIKLVPKGGSAPGFTTGAFVSK